MSAKLNLDNFQQLFVDSEIEENQVDIVKASAGSGKTTTTLARINKLYGVFPQAGVLATTFTNSAGKELKQRYKKLFPDTKIPKISTLHSFGIYVAKRYFDEPISTLTEWKSTLLVREAVIQADIFEDGTSMRDLTAYAKEVLEILNFLKAARKINSIDDLDTFNMSEEWEPTLDITDEEFRDIAITYEELKAEHNYYDYADCIFKVTNKLKKDKRALLKVRKSFQFAFIDEAQDLDLSQFEMITTIFAGNYMCFVGDVMQALYVWRYSRQDLFSVEYFRQFSDNVKEFFIKNNYRSTANIVNVSNMVRAIAKDNIEAIPFHPTKKGSVKYLEVKNNLQEGQAIAEQVKFLIENDICELKDIAVISRSNNYFKTIVEPAFIRHNIDYTLATSKTGKKLSDHPLYNTYFNLLQAAVNVKDYLAILELAPLLNGIGEAFVNKVRVQMTSANLDSVMKLYSRPQDISKIQAIKEVSDFVVGLHVMIKGNLAPKDIIGDMTKFILDKFNKELKVSMVNLEIAEKTILGWINYNLQENTEEEYSVMDAIEETLFDLDNFDTDPDKNTVTLGTVHYFKGMEKPVTIVSGFNSPIQKDYTKDEAFVLYVQLSRAIDKLIIIDSNTWIKKDGSVGKNYKNPYFKETLRQLF